MTPRASDSQDFLRDQIWHRSTYSFGWAVLTAPPSGERLCV
jgi:hypothetical protein